MASEICVPYLPFQRLKLANFGIFAGDMDMDRCREVTSIVYTDIVTFPRSTEVSRSSGLQPYPYHQVLLHRHQPGKIVHHICPLHFLKMTKITLGLVLKSSVRPFRY